jgi:hypothetical protein
MKINLRKASVVQDQIQAELKQLGAEKTEVTVNIFDTDVESKLDAQLFKVRESNQRVGRFLEANSYLRAAVAQKNAEVGITGYLAEDAMLAAAEARTRAVTELEVRPNLDSLNQEMQSRRASANSTDRVSLYGGRGYEMSVNIATQEYVDEARRSLETIRRRRRKIKDEMVTINVRTEIEVPEKVALVLTELGLD